MDNAYDGIINNYGKRDHLSSPFQYTHMKQENGSHFNSIFDHRSIPEAEKKTIPKTSKKGIPPLEGLINH